MKKQKIDFKKLKNIKDMNDIRELKIDKKELKKYQLPALAILYVLFIIGVTGFSARFLYQHLNEAPAPRPTGSVQVFEIDIAALNTVLRKLSAQPVQVGASQSSQQDQ